MAKIGLKNLVYKGPVNAGVVSQVNAADISIEVNDAPLYGDDVLCENDTSFKSGTITLGINELPDTIQAEFLGHAIAGGEMTASATDTAPYEGIGFYAKKTVLGVKSWRAIFFNRVQFKEPADSQETKGESVSFKTASLEGKIMKDPTTEVWKNEKTFALEDDAKQWLNAKAGLPVTASGGLTALALTGTGGTLSPAFGAAIRSYVFNSLTGASFTVTATAANHIMKLYVDGVYVQDLLSGTASAAQAMSIGTKKFTIIAQEVGKQSQTTEIIVVKTA